MDTQEILLEAVACASVHNLDVSDILDFALQTARDVQAFSRGSDRAWEDKLPEACACGDTDMGVVAGMCDDCFNVGCTAGSPCFWTHTPHEEE